MRRFVFSLVLAAALSASATAQQKKRVAVINFDYATVRSSVAAIWGTDQDIGKGIADLIVEKLVASGKYSVIERKALDKILSEQNFSNSDRADPNSAAKIGRVLGVDAIVMGSITQFGRDDKSTGVGGGAMSRVTGRFGIGGVQAHGSQGGGRHQRAHGEHRHRRRSSPRPKASGNPPAREPRCSAPAEARWLPAPAGT